MLVITKGRNKLQAGVAGRRVNYRCDGKCLLLSIIWMYSSAFDDVAKIHRRKSSAGKAENVTQF